MGGVEIRIRTRGFLINDSQSRLPAPAFSRLHDISITHLNVIGLVGLWDAFRLRKRQINRVTILSERPLKLTSECEEYEQPRVLGNTYTSITPSAESRLSRWINSPNNDFKLGKKFRRCPLLGAMLPQPTPSNSSTTLCASLNQLSRVPVSNAETQRVCRSAEEGACFASLHTY